MKKWLVLLTAVLLQSAPTHMTAQAQATRKVTEAAAKTGAALRTPWGEPDLEGIWTDDFSTPMQRPKKYGNREFLTEAERTEQDKVRAVTPITGEVRRGIPLQDLGAAYNAVFRGAFKPTGHRTSLVVDPADGRIPPYTAEAQKRRAAILEFENALLQATEICKNNLVGCSGWQYAPPSPRRFDTPPYYITLTARNGGSGGAINRTDGPEDRTLLERCMSGGLPSAGIPRIVQSRGVVSIFYEMGQGQGFQRIIPITNAPHLPAAVRQWWGDSRGRWEGETLVVDVTNFNAKREYQGSRETFHLIERFSRLDANTLEYQATIDDPTTWTRPWTFKQEWTRKDERANQMYYEPRCHEGNYGLVGALVGARADERAFAEGRGPDPATICSGNCGNAVDEVAEAAAN